MDKRCCIAWRNVVFGLFRCFAGLFVRFILKGVFFLNGKEKAHTGLPSQCVPVLAGLGQNSFSVCQSTDVACLGLDSDYIKLGENFQSADVDVKQNFAPKKISSGNLSNVYSELGFNSRASRVSECGSYLEYRITEHDAKLYHANFCKDRLCPMCNWRRSKKIFGQVSQIMNVLENEYDFIFLTLTVKNCVADNLPATVSALLDGWRFLYNKDKKFRNTVLGTFRALEITRNKTDGTYHPHLHTILAVKRSYWKKGYLTQKQWSDMWRNACDLDYNPIVDVRRIRPKKVDVAVAEDFSLGAAVAEVAKYAVKDTDFLVGTLEEQKENVSAFLAALSRRRLVATTGVFKKVQQQLALDDLENGDLVNTDSDTLRSDIYEIIVSYQWKAGFYVRL